MHIVLRAAATYAHAVFRAADLTLLSDLGLGQRANVCKNSVFLYGPRGSVAGVRNCTRRASAVWRPPCLRACTVCMVPPISSSPGYPFIYWAGPKK
eukprot:878806-Pyramimonas_sp.AAC.1